MDIINESGGKMRFKTAAWLVPACVAVAGFARTARADDDTRLTGNINVILGGKSLDHDQWKPVDGQFLFGVQSDLRRPTWPISLAVNVLSSLANENEDGVDVTGSTFEFGVGVRKNFDTGGKIVPYLGAGPAFMRGNFTTDQDYLGGRLHHDDAGNTVGYWADGGVFFHVGRLLNLGIGARYSSGKVDLLGQKVKVGGSQFGLLGGIHF
jgi:opacity protein-like surface antigen